MRKVTDKTKRSRKGESMRKRLRVTKDFRKGK